jgi:hypothetical protein
VVAATALDAPRFSAQRHLAFRKYATPLEVTPIILFVVSVLFLFVLEVRFLSSELFNSNSNRFCAGFISGRPHFR